MRRKQVELLICPNLAAIGIGIGKRYTITAREWANKRQRAAAMSDLEEHITEAFTVASTREVGR